MSARKSRGRAWKTAVGGAFALVGIWGLLLMFAHTHTQAGRWAGQLSDPDPAVRIAALERLDKRMPASTYTRMIELVQKERDLRVLAAAAKAAVRIGGPAADLLRQRADDSIDDPVRARLIVAIAHAARKNPGRSLVEWLKKGAASSEPWRRMGSAAALLELGDLSGGQVLIDIARQCTPKMRIFALSQLGRIAAPMAEAVGYRIDWSRKTRPDPVLLTRIQAFWKEHATTTLLRDTLARLENTDPRWRRVSRFIENRELVAIWMRLMSSKGPA